MDEGAGWRGWFRAFVVGSFEITPADADSAGALADRSKLAPCDLN